MANGDGCGYADGLRSANAFTSLSLSISVSHRPIWKITIFHKQFNTEIEKSAFCSWLMQVENPLSAIAFVEWSENLIHRKPLRLYTKPPGIFRYLYTIALLEWDENIEIAYIFREEREEKNQFIGWHWLSANALSSKYLFPANNIPHNPVSDGSENFTCYMLISCRVFTLSATEHWAAPVNVNQQCKY